MDRRIRSLGKFVFRLTLSGAALYIVFKNIDSQQLLMLLFTTNLLWLAGALIIFNISKVVSSLRLTYYFRANGIQLSEPNNLRLYYIGMFYNLFLPGGIGGDGYKIWLLNRNQSISAKQSFQSLFFDRFSGMMLLVALGFLFGWMAFPEARWRPLLLIGLVSALPGNYLLHLVFARHFLPIVRSTTVLSLGVQGLQVFCAWLLLMSLGIHEHTQVYLTVFLVSSVVSVLPISIGGIGLRELVFITAAGFSPISKDASVAFSLMFLFVTAISSLPGGILTMPRSTKS